jgi:hypothetical protein
MILTTFKSVKQAYVDLRLDMPWLELADLLLTHNDIEKKTDVELYNMLEFKTLTDPTVELGRKFHYINGIKQETYDLIPGTIRRSKNNVVAMHGIVLDVDEYMNIEQAIDTLDGLEYVLYTTFRHTLEKHKFRIVIPFSQPLKAEDIECRQQDIIDTFPGVDNASFTVSQCFYFHSGKQDNIAYHNKGVMIDPYDFKYQPVIVNTPAPVKIQFNDIDDEQLQAYKIAVVDSLLSCSGLHYAGKGDNNKGVLTLISICKSIGLSYNEFDHICNQIADSSSELKKQNVRHDAWVSWPGDRVRKETRDRFIKNYNGKPINIVMPGYGKLTKKKILKRATNDGKETDK